MREPAFWYRPPSLLSRLLLPLGAIYGQVAAWRMRSGGFDAGIPVICVGNYHTGGAGKTPAVLALTKLLRELGETPVVLSRGYGGKWRGPVKVDSVRHIAANVGDEPLMLAQTVAVVIARDRIGGIALARSQGASVILMDDGFQNPAIAKDAAIIVIDGDRGLGNGGVFPAGPLRAPLPPLARWQALLPRRPNRCCGRISSRPPNRWRGSPASACWRLPGSATPAGFSGHCAAPGSMSSSSGPLPITIRFPPRRSTR